MNNHRCRSQKSLITIRKWLSEAGDGPSKIIKRKKFNYQKYHSKTTSIIDWFYEFIKNIFTVYDDNHFKSNQLIDDTNLSIRTCSSCQSELYSKIMLNTTTNNSNFHLTKSTQTQLNHNEQIFPFILSSSLLSIHKQKSNQSIPLLTTDNHSTNTSMNSLNSNKISLETTKNLPRSLSLHDTRICHFDKNNCLIECYHSSNPNRNNSDILFAESTCQLIRQSWISSISNQQM